MTRFAVSRPAISPSIDRCTAPDMRCFLRRSRSAASEKLTSVPPPAGENRKSPRGRTGPATTWNENRADGSFAVTPFGAEASAARSLDDLMDPRADGGAADRFDLDDIREPVRVVGVVGEERVDQVVCW